MGWWTDTIYMGLWLCDWSRGSAEKCLALQLCFLVPTLGCHLIDWVIFLDKRDAPSQVSPNKTRFPPKSLPIIYKTHAICRTPPQQPAVKRQHAPVVLGRGPEKNTVSHIVFAKAHTDCTLTLVTSDMRSRESLLPTWITILLYLGLALASSFSFDSMSPAVAPGMQLTMVTGVAKFTFLRTESPMTRVCFSTGPSLSCENLCETWAGWSLIVCFLRIALCPLQTV